MQGRQALQRNFLYCYFAPEIGENFDSERAVDSGKPPMSFLLPVAGKGTALRQLGE